jgi:hypothetical protein
VTSHPTCAAVPTIVNKKTHYPAIPAIPSVAANNMASEAAAKPTGPVVAEAHQVDTFRERDSNCDKLV